jgi:Mn2+/Fe2+ NRAMP family transporter
MQRTIARIFKWFTVALLAYILAAFLAKPDWHAVFESTFIPRIQWSNAYLATLVAIFGTTISPYLFFWQAAEEVEELHSHKETTRCDAGALRNAQTDVVSGMFFSNLVMYFVILTAAATLYVNGHRDISTSRQAAEALRPLAGDGAYSLFTIGLVGAGMLGVPVLAGSSAYAIAEAAKWRGSLDETPKVAHGFYAVLVLAVLLGLGVDFAGFNAVQMLFWAAVVNGVLAPPLIIVIVLLTRDPRVMGSHVNPR